MRRQLSSGETLLVKLIFPLMWIGALGFLEVRTLFTKRENLGSNLGSLLIWLVVSWFIYRTCVRLKKVSIDDHNLYVSNYFREIAIPLSYITQVTENVWINHEPVTIHLQFSTEFGDTIVFMPKTRMFHFFSEHPVVGELRRLTGLS
jgi:hypothetical protein